MRDPFIYIYFKAPLDPSFGVTIKQCPKSTQNGLDYRCDFGYSMFRPFHIMDLREHTKHKYGQWHISYCESQQFLSLPNTIYNIPSKVLEFIKPEEFVYYTDNVGKCRCHYKIVSGVSRRISKVAFDLLSKS